MHVCSIDKAEVQPTLAKLQRRVVWPLWIICVVLTYLLGYMECRCRRMYVRYEHWGGRRHVIVPSFYHSWCSKQVETPPWQPVSEMAMATYTASPDRVSRLRWYAWLHRPIRFAESLFWRIRNP